MQNPGNRSIKSISRTVMLVALDAVLINLSMILAMQLQHDMMIPVSQMRRFTALWPIMTVMCLSAFAVARLYHNLWEYASVDEVIQIALGTLIGVGATMAFSLIAYQIQPRPNQFLLFRSTYLIDWFILTFLMLGSRFSVRLLRRMGIDHHAMPRSNRARVMILGAGWAGAGVIREMTAAAGRKGVPVVALDDDCAKANTRIGRVPVKCGIANLKEYAQQYQVDEVVIAIPSAPPERMREIVEMCMSTKLPLKMLPGLRDMTGGPIRPGALREVNIADLLCREEVRLDVQSICGYLQGKTVLVTGGGGSIGSELCRQIAKYNPGLLIVFDIYENNAYDLVNELKRIYGAALNAKILIGSIRDEKRLDEVFAKYRPDVVFHAAAHKHVPLMEENPAEAVKNNVFGTFNVARCADKHGCDRFVMLSTDKAVNPTNIMGATKRVTELIMQYMCARSDTHFMAVRFGNVLGSNGSVVPLFKQQIAAGGPVTVMHPDITRYFMTIPEASQLVLQAGAINETGAVFVLDMGTPVKIMDLARNLIRLSGFEPGVDIRIDIVGLRPGEKLYEELVMHDEQKALKKTACDKITVAHPVGMNGQVFEHALEALRVAAFDHPELVEKRLTELVPSFRREPGGVGRREEKASAS